MYSVYVQTGVALLLFYYCVNRLNDYLYYVFSFRYLITKSRFLYIYSCLRSYKIQRHYQLYMFILLLSLKNNIHVGIQTM